MSSVILQPAGDPYARAHYADTIATPVRLERLGRHLGTEDLAAIRRLQSLACVIPRYDLATEDARLSLKRASIDTDHRNVRKKNVIAAGLPQSFRQEVARALESEPDAIGWLPSMPSVEEYLIGADPPADVIVLSPQVRVRARRPPRPSWPTRLMRSTWQSSSHAPRLVSP